MSKFLDSLNDRILATKSLQLIANMTPLERVAKEAESYAVVHKDWAKYNAEHKGVPNVHGVMSSAHADSIPRKQNEENSHQKDLNAENWHTKTMAAFKDKSNDSLKFIRQDAHEASMANPDNPKAGQYMDEVHYAGMELSKRQKHFAKK